MGYQTPRREFLKEFSTLAAAVAAMQAAGSPAAEEERRAGKVPGPEKAAAAMPRIKLGQLEVSRLILGSNPFFGFTHGNPQASSQEMRTFYTPERIMAVMDAAAELGINAVWTPCYEHWVRLWNEYQAKGGKLKYWIAQPDREPMIRDLDIAIKNGAKAICIQGIRVDNQIGRGNFAEVRRWLEHIKSHGLPAGIATHQANTHLLAEEKGLPTDFYHQTLYRPDHYVPQGLEESLAVIEKLVKPVVAYKALGAGRIAPKDTLPVIFKRLKPKDGLCVGVFPKHRDELAENTTLVRRLSGRA